MPNSQSCKEYLFFQALRPFSFSVVVVTCATGLMLAWTHGSYAIMPFICVIIGALLLQAGVNLINDYADLHTAGLASSLKFEQVKRIRRNFLAGIFCFMLAIPIGLYFSVHLGWPFFALCVVGLIGALGYTLPPLNYKARGLGVILVFWLMGVALISGSYFAVTATMQWSVFFISIPVSLLVSLLLLSNELRDYEADSAAGISTFSVKFGYVTAKNYFRIMLLSVYSIQLMLSAYFQSYSLLLPVLSAVLVPKVLGMLDSEAHLRRLLPPTVGKLLLLFGVLLNMALYMAE